MLTYELNYLLLLDYADTFPLPRYNIYNIKVMGLKLYANENLVS